MGPLSAENFIIPNGLFCSPLASGFCPNVDCAPPVDFDAAAPVDAVGAGLVVGAPDAGAAPWLTVNATAKPMLAALPTARHPRLRVFCRRTRRSCRKIGHHLMLQGKGARPRSGHQPHARHLETFAV